MNIKKVFASLTGVLMLATTVTPLVTGAAHYGAELEGAYAYAYSKGITTMPSIDSANMYGEVTRGQLAKMISNWAEAELGKTADVTRVCSFTDEGKAAGDLAMYLKKACQMGLMGQGIANFRPNDKVTRGEFGTTLSRALWGGMYEGGNPYYANHLMALRDAGIMTRIETPSQLEIRGYVMLMLQRAVASKKDTTSCTDPMIMLACGAELSTCPAECKKTDEKKEETTPTVVKAGDLKVTATPAEQRRALIGKISDLDTVTLVSDQDINLRRVVLERYGYSSANDVESVWLEDMNGVRITHPGNLVRDRVALNILRDYRTVSKKEQFTIVVKLKGEKITNGTIGFKVAEVDSSAKNLDLTAYTPYQYDITDYTGAGVALTLRGKVNGTIHNYTPNTMFEVAKFQIRAGQVPVIVKGFTLTETGSLDLDRYLDKVEVLVDGKAVGGLYHKIERNDKTTFSFDGVKIDSNRRATFVVRVSLKDLMDFNKTVEYSFKDGGDLNAVEEKTGSRVSATGDNVGKSNTYTFKGTQVRLVNNRMSTTVEATKGSVDLVIGQGNIELSDAIILDKFDVTTEGTGLLNLRMAIAGEEYVAAKTGHGNGDKFTFNNIYIEKNASVKFLADIEDDGNESEVKTINIKSSFSKSSFAADKIGTYQESGQKIDGKEFIGSISLSNVKLQKARGALFNDTSKEVEFLVKQSAKKPVFEGEFVAQKQALTLDTFAVKLDSGNGLTENDLVEFHLYLNGNEVGTVSLDQTAGTKSISGDISRFDLAKGEKVKVKLEANVNVAQTGDYRFSLALAGVDKDGFDIREATAQTTKLKVVESVELNVVDRNISRNTVVVRSDNLSLANFSVRSPANVDGSTLEKIIFKFADGTTKTNINNVANLRLKIAGSDVELKDSMLNDGTLTVDKLNESIDGEVAVELLAKSALAAGDYKVVVESVNTTRVGRDFNKKLVNGLVSIAKQEDVNQGSTRYTINVETYKENGQQTPVISNLKLYTSDTEQVGTTLENVVNGDVIEVPNNIGSIAYITKIEWNDGETRTIEKKTYNDFFKLDGTYLKVFRAR